MTDITEKEIIEILKAREYAGLDKNGGKVFNVRDKITYKEYPETAKVILDKIKEGEKHAFENTVLGVPIPCPFCEYGIPSVSIPNSLKKLKQEHDLYHKLGGNLWK